MSNPVQAVLDTITDRVDPEPDGIQSANGNLWTSIRRLRDDGNKNHTEFSKSDVDDAVSLLEDNDDILRWYGILAPTTDEHLEAIIENERRCDYPRDQLIWVAEDLLDGEAAENGGEAA